MATNLDSILFHLLLSLTLTTTIANDLVSTTKPRRIVTKLLHHNSLLHNPNDTIDVRAERLINSSVARFIYLSEKTFETRLQNNVQPNLFLGIEAHLFYVNFSIGQPPVPQLATMDTGSNLIWVNCKPSCKSCNPVLDPSKSSTFSKTPCNYTFCSHCSPTKEYCNYSIEYVRGPDSKGIIATERFYFETSDEGRTIVNDVFFGCGLTNINFPDNSTGVFGLGMESGSENLSIVKLLGSKFSYCVGNINDDQYKFNRLVLGEGAIIEGYSTPLEISGGFYYVTLEGISIGEKRLDIDSDIFQKTSSKDGVFIDSGSTFTWLAPTAYEVVSREIENLCNGLLTQYFSPWWRGHLCYFGEIGRDLQGFPVMTFHFAEGADLVLDVWGVFLQIGSRVFCLAIASNDFVGNSRVSKDRSLIGMMAQQNYNVAYDLGENRLYFQRIDCELLDD